MTPTFRVLNPDGSEPDLAKITDKERWARCIDWRDVEGAAVTSDGHVVLFDGLGNLAFAPDGRFVVRWDEK